MSGKKKHRNISPESFRDYLSDRMSEEERNAFEKELQKDPFVEEALEGLSSLNEKDLQTDLDELHSRLHHTESSQSHRVVLYRIAAAIAGIILVTSAYLIFDKKISELKTDRMARIEKNEKPAPDQAEAGPPEQKSMDRSALTGADSSGNKNKEFLRETQAPRNAEGKEIHKKSVETALKDETRAETISGKSAVPDIAQTVVSTDEMKNTEVVPGIALSEPSPMTKRAAPQTRLPEKIDIPEKGAAKPGYVSGTIISTEDSSPVVGASVVVKGTTQGTVSGLDGKYTLDLPASDTSVTLVASMVGMESREVETGPDSNLNIDLKPDVTSLDEVVVIRGYSEQKKSDRTGAVSVLNPENEKEVYTEPTPVGGFDGFKEYVDKNQVWPQGYPDINRAVVVLKFSINADNRPTDIQVVKSPGDDFSKEAVRLLKNGPDWSRAMMRDSVVDTEIKIRIAFKR